MRVEVSGERDSKIRIAFVVRGSGGMVTSEKGIVQV
jgi:hypothetical protein